MVLKGQGRPHWSVESMLVIFFELFCFCFIEILNLSFYLAVGFDTHEFLTDVEPLEVLRSDADLTDSVPFSDSVFHACFKPSDWLN